MSPRPVDKDPDLSTFFDSSGEFHLVSTSPQAIEQQCRRHRGVHSLHTPTQEGMVKIIPKINLDPQFTQNGQLEIMLDQTGVVAYRPIVVENFFGTFRSKIPLVTSIVHGSIDGMRHVVEGKIESDAYFTALRDTLLDLHIRPPQVFISCDPQSERQGNFPIRLIRFGQNGDNDLLSFPYLINIISINDQGAIIVHERDMKLEAKSNSGSPFANPTKADFRLLQLVEKLFTCPDRFTELMSERLENQITIIPAKRD